VRAVRFERYGPADVLQVVEVAEPQPLAGDVKVKIFAASLDPLDWKIRAGHVRFIPMFARPPRTVGTELAGEIVGVGGGPGPRHIGERVFGSLSPYGRDGSCAEYAVIGAHRVVPIPEGISYEQAAAAPVAGGTAAQALMDDAKVAAGQRVLIIGAAGGVGHFAVQMAKYLDAYVVATCSASNVEFVRELGADEVVDYSKDEVTGRSDKFDVVLDTADALGWRRARSLLTPGGLYLGMGGSTSTAIGTAVAGMFTQMLAGMRAQTFLLKTGGASCRRLAELLAREVLKPHITHRVSLEQVADAQRRMETGHGRGKTVVLPHGPVL
jgi:NADPH:quinone reductase-like Zn-dependent oxidoreductase